MGPRAIQVAQHAIQTIDGCAAAGGVHDEHTSSAQFFHIFIETGATIFSSKDVGTYDEKALFYGG